MNASATPVPKTGHRICLSLGSNIDPAENIRRAVALLRQQAWNLAFSACYETRPVGGRGGNFLNMAVCLSTYLDADQFKQQVVAPIEASLGRVRTADKYAPRTIDLDIIVFDDQVLDEQLWQQVHLALPVSELLPELANAESGETLPQTASRLLRSTPATLRPEVYFSS